MGMANTIFSSNRMAIAWSAVGQVANYIGEVFMVFLFRSPLQCCSASCCMLLQSFLCPCFSI